DDAIANYLNAAKVLEAHNDINGLAQIYSNIGGAYQIMINFEQAIQYFKKAEQLAIKTDDQDGLGSVYISLSDIGLYQGIPTAESIDYAEKAIKIFRQND